MLLSLGPCVDFSYCIPQLLWLQRVFSALSCPGARMSAPSIAAQYLEYARAQKVLTRSEAEHCAQLCNAAWVLMLQNAKELVLEAGDSPVLYTYGSDATPIIATTTVQFKVGDLVHSRRAGHPEEYLVQRGFVKCYGPGEQVSVRGLFKPPVPLTEGKSAWHAFTAMTELFPMIRRVPFKGLIVSHYTFDRALFSSLERKARQRHQLYYERQADGPERSGAAALAELTDWVVSTPCACHDAHNALKWALHPFAAEEPDTVSHLHVCVQALRNGFSLLHGRLPSFIVAHLDYQNLEDDTQHLYTYWTSLGLTSEVAEEAQLLAAAVAQRQTASVSTGSGRPHTS